MSTTFFSSDWHVGHARILELSHRPFSSVDEMAQTLIDNWNAVVGPDDVGWLLGDLAIEGQWKLGLEAARQLQGRLRLVEGNHDQVWSGKSTSLRYRAAYNDVFEVAVPWARVKIGQHKCMLSHFPYVGDHTEEERFEFYRLRLSDRPLIHGHTHGSETLSFANSADGVFLDVPQYHVGVDAHGFRPVASHTIQKVLDDFYG